MTIALLIALGGSLVAMAVIVKKLEQKLSALPGRHSMPRFLS